MASMEFNVNLVSHGSDVAPAGITLAATPAEGGGGGHASPSPRRYSAHEGLPAPPSSSHTDYTPQRRGQYAPPQPPDSHGHGHPHMSLPLPEADATHLSSQHQTPLQAAYSTVQSVFSGREQPQSQPLGDDGTRTTATSGDCPSRAAPLGGAGGVSAGAGGGYPTGVGHATTSGASGAGFNTATAAAASSYASRMSGGRGAAAGKPPPTELSLHSQPLSYGQAHAPPHVMEGAGAGVGALSSADAAGPPVSGVPLASHEQQQSQVPHQHQYQHQHQHHHPSSVMSAHSVQPSSAAAAAADPRASPASVFVGGGGDGAAARPPHSHPPPPLPPSQPQHHDFTASHAHAVSRITPARGASPGGGAFGASAGGDIGGPHTGGQAAAAAPPPPPPADDGGFGGDAAKLQELYAKFLKYQQRMDDMERKLREKDATILQLQEEAALRERTLAATSQALTMHMQECEQARAERAGAEARLAETARQLEHEKIVTNELKEQLSRCVVAAGAAARSAAAAAASPPAAAPLLLPPNVSPARQVPPTATARIAGDPVVSDRIAELTRADPIATQLLERALRAQGDGGGLAAATVAGTAPAAALREELQKAQADAARLSAVAAAAAAPQGQRAYSAHLVQQLEEHARRAQQEAERLAAVAAGGVTGGSSITPRIADGWRLVTSGGLPPATTPPADGDDTAAMALPLPRHTPGAAAGAASVSVDPTRSTPLSGGGADPADMHELRTAYAAQTERIAEITRLLQQQAARAEETDATQVQLAAMIDELRKIVLDREMRVAANGSVGVLSTRAGAPLPVPATPLSPHAAYPRGSLGVASPAAAPAFDATPGRASTPVLRGHSRVEQSTTPSALPPGDTSLPVELLRILGKHR